MSMKTLPILFINLGGEMLYILDQRLRAQNIAKEKANKVMHDITSTMFDKRFMEELFKPQELYSKKALRSVFDKLAHASIMRLNAASMDKLYDLMSMALKYQVSLCLRPNDVLLTTLNHMDAIRDFVEESAPIKQQVEHVYRLLAQHYASMSPGEFMLMRQTLLNFFQDMHIRVSIFLRDKVQGQNGRFVLPVGGPVPYGTQVPGTVKTFDGNSRQLGKKSFNPGGNFVECKRQGSYDTCGDRVTKLGGNMYSGHHKPLETNFNSQAKPQSTPSAQMDMTPNPMAKAHLDLLAKLIGSGDEKRKGSKEFRLNLFNTDEEEEEAAVLRPQFQDEGSQVVNIDASKKTQDRRLARIMGELTVSGNDAQGDDDLLDLMDSAT